MAKKIRAGGFTVELLAEGDELYAGGKVGAGFTGLRIDDMTELVGSTIEVAGMLRRLHTEIAGSVPTGKEPQILLLGDLARGFEAFGPFSADDPGERAHARILTLQEEGEDYVQMPLKPLQNLVPIDPDPAAAASGRDIEIEGVGTIKADDTYIQLVNGDGSRSNCYALVGRELIEAYEIGEDGYPDWKYSSICDERGGDPGFLYPAHSILRYLNTTARSKTCWYGGDHNEVQRRLKTAAIKGLIRAWIGDPTSGGYKVVPHGTGDDRMLRSPEEAYAFLDGVEIAGQAAGK